MTALQWMLHALLACGLLILAPVAITCAIVALMLALVLVLLALGACALPFILTASAWRRRRGRG